MTLSLSQNHRRIAIRLAADLLRNLLALGAILVGLAHPFLLHAAIDRVAVLRRKIGPANAHVDDLDAEILRLGVHAITDVEHKLRPLAGKDGGKGLCAKDAAHIGAENRLQTDAGDVLIRERLIEAQRIGDSPASECVHDEALLVLRYHLFGRQIEIKHPFVEIEDVLKRPGRLEVQAWIRDHLARRAPLQHESKLRLVHGKERGKHKEQEDHSRDDETDDAMIAHWRPPCASAVARPAAGAPCLNSGNGR